MRSVVDGMWGSGNYCQSVDLSGFSGFLLEEHSARYTCNPSIGIIADFFSWFEYCAGTGGYRLCSNDSDTDINTASVEYVLNVHTRVLVEWYEVELFY